jgi:HemY protein
MIAAGAGDAELARRMTKQASKLLSSDQEPLIKLLDAQAAVLERRNDEARAKFEEMSNDPETRLLGLRGLYLEAERLGEREAARHYAMRAAELAPQLQWAANVALEDKLSGGDFDGALALIDKQKRSGVVDKEADRRRRAVLLTGKAISLFDRDLAASKAASMEANRLAPELVPAAAALARALFKHGDLRKGSGVLEAAWKIEPHPELALAYVYARVGDSAPDRLKRARKLVGVHPDHPESHLALARALYEAKEFAEARKEAEAALAIRNSESACLLLADIEQADGANQGKMRAWLAKAVRAEPDPAWTADGMVSAQWAPFSPVSGRIDAFEWKVPVRRLQPAVEIEIEEVEDIAPIVTTPPIVSSTAPVIEVVTAPQRDRTTATDILPTPPDDPGVKPELVNVAPKRRFRLF